MAVLRRPAAGPFTAQLPALYGCYFCCTAQLTTFTFSRPNGYYDESSCLLFSSLGGPDFFIALASHPEWGNGHTVWGEVLEQDMTVVDQIMVRPLKVSNWGVINATELVTPMPFSVVAHRRKLSVKGEHQSPDQRIGE